MDKDDFIWSLPAPMKSFLAVSNYMDENGIKTPLAEIVGAAIYQWIAAQRAKREEATANHLDGYQWKSLYLPAGTVLRTVVKGKSHVAHVRGNELIYDNAPTTPARFVNAAHGCCNNAWTCLWLRFPGNPDWKPAKNLRTPTAVAPTSRKKRTNKKI